MEEVLKQLEGYQSGQIVASQLEKDLEEAIKKTLTDHEFRLHLGSKERYWKLFNAVLLTLNQDSNESCLVNLIKLTRNVVAGNTHNQQLAIQHGSMYKIENLLFEKKSSSSDNNMILQVGTQAICNILTNNSTAIDFIWKIWMTNEERGSIWSYILSKSNQDLIMCALILIINCIRGSKERCELLVTKSIGQAIIAAILGDIERLHDNQESKNFELGYTIFNELISCHYFNTLYTNVDDYSEKNLLSDHQVILLKFLDSKINTAIKKQEFPNFIQDKELLLLVQQLSVLGKETANVIESIKESGSSSCQEEQLTNIYTGIILLLQIINELFVLDQESRIKQLLIEYNILPIAVDILGHLQAIKLPPTDENNPEIGFHFLKRECVRVLGTICYKDTSMQDKIRELGGIPLVLAQLRIDDSNPYIREYALLALRNLLENNPENQKIIEELEAEKVVESQELAQMGYRPELLENGQVRLKKL